MTDAGLLSLDERGVLAVSGPQRAKFLHNLLSNAVEGLAAGQGCLAALMDAKGHLLVLMRLLVDASEILLEMPRERLAAIEAQFVHYKVGTPVRFAARDVAVLALVGPGADAVVSACGAPLPGAAPQSHVVGTIGGAAVRVVRATDLPGPALAIHCGAESASPVATALRAAGAASLSRAAFDALRVERGRPLFGIDVTEANLLHETGLVAEYHSAAKGCYVGQEVIARLEARGGNVNKLLRGLRLSSPAAAGAALEAEGREVGRLTTTGVSAALGPIAMGYVHRNEAAPGTQLSVGGSQATVAALPMVGA